MLNEKPYGRLIEPNEEPRFQINLLPGKQHQFYVKVTPKDETEETLKSNTIVRYKNSALLLNFPILKIES